ncbi:galactitol-1-phosphate 5-dehydrogenase [Maledivibacter halophilus]|uniref:Galactitol-1-phosphate 5-dehydrogenase n=1 Tax=Maledivibacter halophilus TaxID=36842 RepID=A0A1T5JTX9_9FIRM|nr:galactitol-1-phosphate 5-dehydrogenase [Maledivibacter halophilus]SKC54658.1 galactitol-1-phosphate 5-dehydrogenase [Maledivibacter halophilus]
MGKMKALLVHGKGDLRYEGIEIPKYGEDEVLIRVRACGICGSDIPRAMGDGARYYPIVLGHEFSGEIVNIGSEVENLKIGNKVIAAPLLPCGQCHYCKIAKPAMCENYGFLGSRQNGTMAEYVAVKAENVIKIPDYMDYDLAAMVEPVTVALHGIERINLRAGETCIVFGAGTIGLLTLQCLKALGAGKVYIVDIVKEKLDIAKKLGADEAIDPREVNLIDHIKKNGKPLFAFETAGTPVTQRQCIDVVDKLGEIVYIGTAHGKVELDGSTFEKILRGELLITGSWMSYSGPYPGHEWNLAINLIKEGKINLKPLITHSYGLKDGMKAFETMVDKNENSIKIMLNI